jgi:hypothetical protein
MPDKTQVERVVRSAWERRLLVVAIERGAIAAALVLAALVLMLLVGTQILDWRWLGFLAVVGLGTAGYQVRERLLEHYRVAQLLDRRLQLADSLSTAWYLLSSSAKRQDPIAEYQLRGAERAAGSVDVARAFPLTGRKLWSIAGGLALVAVSLFSVRYLVTNSLSLRQSLIPLRLSEVLERTDKDSDQIKRQREEAQGSDERGQKATPKADGQKDAKEPPRGDTPPLANGEGAGAGQNPNEPAEMQDLKTQDGQGKQRKDGDAGASQQRAGAKQGDEAGQNAGAQKPGADDQANNPKSSNGLIDRMKDALSSLAAKMRPNSQNKQDANQRSGEDKKGDQQGASREQNNQPRQDASNRESSEQQQSSEGQGQGQTQEKTRSGQGKTADQSADKSKSDAHSGIGSQDGDKSTKDAEQLKAMGKLAEIIGKRSESATGDVMVENPSGKQQLQTNYSQRSGHHSDLGGEINRDEIPVIYQQYIREYMSQVRQQTLREQAKRHPEQQAPEISR